MADNSHIGWTDATWNPLVGCTKVSAGCDNCYAETLVNRFAGHNPAFPNRFDVLTPRQGRRPDPLADRMATAVPHRPYWSDFPCLAPDGPQLPYMGPGRVPRAAGPDWP